MTLGGTGEPPHVIDSRLEMSVVAHAGSSIMSWYVVGTPLGPAGRGLVMFVDNVGVTAASKYPAETFEYLTYVCGYEAGMELWRDYRSVPGCRPDIWESEEALADPHFKVNTEMLQAEGMPPRLPCPANFREKEYWQVVNEGLEPIWTGERTFDEVMPDVVQAGQETLDRPSLLT